MPRLKQVLLLVDFSGPCAKTANSVGVDRALQRRIDALACREYSAFYGNHLSRASPFGAAKGGSGSIQERDGPLCNALICFAGLEAGTKFAACIDQTGLRSKLILRDATISAKLSATAQQQHSDLLIVGRSHTRKALGRLAHIRWP